MKKYFLQGLSIIAVFLLVISLASCGVENAQINWYDFNAEFKNAVSGTVAQNKNYSLIWDSENANVTLYDKNNNVYWSSIPSNAEDVTSQPQVFSQISVSYVESKTLNSGQVHSYSGSVKKKTFSSVKKPNGITVTYYFKDVGISVPVDFALKENGFSVSIDPNSIGEDTELVSKIAVAPFLCSNLNTESANSSYLFTPDGSGALIYPKTTGSGINTLLTKQIYASDGQLSEYPATKMQSIRLPVYGVKCGERALCSIIESGADTSELVANIGSATYGYSAIYPVFNIRGSQTVETKAIMKYSATKKNLFCKGKIKGNITVGFYPLYGSDADYVGMAKCYKNYLKDTKELKKTNSDTLLNIKYIGGMERKKFTLGIPHKSLYVSTTFEDVEVMTNKLLETVNDNINVDLIGFGSNGVNIGKIAGGYKYNSKFGSIRKLKNIDSNDKIAVYFNFDMLRFSKGGSGVRPFVDTSISAIGLKNPKYYTKIAFPDSFLTDESYYLVKREKLEKSGNKIEKATDKWGLSGVSLDTLTSMTYSDYSDSDYYAKSSSEMQVTKIINSMKKNGKKVASFGTNAYAAILSDHIYDAPVSSSGYQVYDCDVPFYQIVFKGIISMSVPSINFTADYNNSFLQAVETGNGLSYTLISKYDKSLMNSKDNAFYSAVFNDNEEKINADVRRYNKLFNNIKNTEIKEHKIVFEGLHFTEFENGTKVYVNYTADAIDTPIGTVKAGDFLSTEVGR